MVHHDNEKSGTVLRGHFGKPAHEPSTIRRRNLNALRGGTPEAQAREMLEDAQLSAKGLVIRATEVWHKTSQANRSLAEKLLMDDVLNAKAIENIAWEFVKSKEDTHKESTPRDAANARAFLILVYGPDAAAY